MLSPRVFPDELSVINLSLPYRNGRSYVHSADIFATLTNLAKDHFSPHAYVESLVLRRQATHHILVSFQAVPQMVGTFSVRADGAQVHGWLVEANAEISARVLYDESPVEAAVVGSFGYARFTEPVAGYTAFEQLLVLLKIVGGLGEREAWLCQINLRGPLLNTQPLAVKLQKIILPFYAFEILQNEQTIGYARASLRG